MGVRMLVVLAALGAFAGCGGVRPDAGGTIQPTAGSTRAVDVRADAQRVQAQDQRSERAAERQGSLLLAAMPRPAGSQSASASQVPALAHTGLSLSGPDLSPTQVGFWLVPVRDVHALADWYSLHPPAGMTSEAHAIGEGRDADGSYSDDVFYNGDPSGPAPGSAAVIELAAVGSNVGVRITVYTSWSPARPTASMAPADVSAVRIDVTTDAKTRSVSVRDPARIAQLVHAYNALPGTHGFAHSCPLQLHQTSYRLTFLGATGSVVATLSASCTPMWTVSANGASLDPALTNPPTFAALVRTVAGGSS